MVPGKGHSNQVQDVVATGDTLVSCGMDDMVMFSKLATIAQSGCVLVIVFFEHCLMMVIAVVSVTIISGIGSTL